MKNVLLEEFEREIELSSSAGHAFVSFLKEKFGIDENGDLKDFDLSKLSEEELAEYQTKKMASDTAVAKRYALSKLLDDNVNGGRGDNTILIKPSFYNVDKTYSIITEAIDIRTGEEIVRIGDESFIIPTDLKEKSIDEQIKYYQNLVKGQAVKDIDGTYAKETEFQNICNKTYDSLPKVNKTVYYKQRFNEFIEKIHKFTSKITDKFKRKDKSDDPMGLQSMVYTDEDIREKLADNTDGKQEPSPEISDDFTI